MKEDKNCSILMSSYSVSALLYAFLLPSVLEVGTQFIYSVTLLNGSLLLWHTAVIQLYIFFFICREQKWQGGTRQGYILWGAGDGHWGIKRRFCEKKEERIKGVDCILKNGIKGLKIASFWVIKIHTVRQTLYVGEKIVL